MKTPTAEIASFFANHVPNSTRGLDIDLEGQIEGPTVRPPSRCSLD